MKTLLSFCCALMIFGIFRSNAQPKDDKILEAKIQSLMKQLTLEEKISMLHANGIFSAGGVQRLNIPQIMTDDGPLGVREDVKEGWGSANLTTDSATFFPNGSALAATWNPELAYRYGHDMGEEARARGKNVMLAPAFNICRVPLCGRTYEYYSEDPFLNARLAVQSVKGIQSEHVAACVKHYAVNNQEIERGRINVDLDERALREIYLPAFKASITEGGAWTIMSAYNKLRGAYCSENDYLLNQVLRGEWKFKGMVISDWGGTHSTVTAALNGLDLEMGSRPPYNTYFFADKLLDSVKAGKVSMKVIDEKVHRVLWVLMHTDMSDKLPAGKLNTPDHSQTAYDIAAESIVLLKNEKHLLPLNLSGIKSISVIGDNATHTFHLGGFGAGVKARYEVTALQGLQNRLGKTVDIKYAQGYSAVYQPYGKNQRTETAKPDPALIAGAVAAAKSTDMAILFVGGNRDYESESRDRKTLDLPFSEQVLVDSVTANNPNTIVVVVGGAPYDIGRIKKNNHTIVWSWYNGSENGNALADVLLGKINPSGKLPFTFPASLKDSPAIALDAYPGKDLHEEYKEGILVGYRWFDTKKIAPLYCFGYGLSYTTFKYSGLTIGKKMFKPTETITVTLKVSNTGKYAGKETVQLYIGKTDARIQRAEKELKAFKKISVPVGKTAAVTFTIPIKDLAYYDVDTHKWRVESGEYKLMAGASSRDIKESVVVTVL
ncbi:MAG TPA: glycoside hydrolase family 3 C-terminal domain-containing protein [Mucilaginibacter sp.]|jgi:beta-glucosidase|nr:glycoside hydrolase family 3 C-terminal domain-containing protein [Mucilaginibacter sp.]